MNQPEECSVGPKVYTQAQLDAAVMRAVWEAKQEAQRKRKDGVDVKVLLELLEQGYSLQEAADKTGHTRGGCWLALNSKGLPTTNKGIRQAKAAGTYPIDTGK